MKFTIANFVFNLNTQSQWHGLLLNVRQDVCSSNSSSGGDSSSLESYEKEKKFDFLKCNNLSCNFFAVEKAVIADNEK